MIGVAVMWGSAVDASRPAPQARAGATATGPVAPVVPLGHVGRWLVDRTGRVVDVHGINQVAKTAPFYPGAQGFGADDADFLVANGFTVVRLGIVWEALEPKPGVIDTAYIQHLVDDAHLLAARHIFVLLDFHQDGWGPFTHGNGAPAWATITDGLDNPNEPFPIYYVTNPALQRAFDNFWANRPASDGVGLQDHYVRAARAVAARFASERYVLGYDPMNEPWPGAVWQPCATGCPVIEHAKLVPFYTRFARAIESVDRHHLVMPEPFVLFNFGQGGTSLPNIDAPRNGLSFHVYAASSSDNLAVMRRAIDSGRRGDALLATEWGAVTDPVAINDTAGQLDATLLPWIFWSYAELVPDASQPPTGANVHAAVVHALARPYPLLTNGVPRRLRYNPSTARLVYEYTTKRPNGITDPLPPTVVVLPPNAYPRGYAVRVDGGRVIAAGVGPDRVAVRNDTGATTVVITVTPA